MSAKEQVSDEALRVAFNKLDTNKSGFIEASELKALFIECGFDAKEAEETANGIMAEDDKNKDKKLSFGEFIAGYKKECGQ